MIAIIEKAVRECQLKGFEPNYINLKENDYKALIEETSKLRISSSKEFVTSITTYIWV